MFVTMFLGILDTRTGMLSYINAGHPTPQLLRASGVVEQADGKPEVPLAVHATNVSHTEARLLGEAGASVCICPTTERDLGDGLANIALLRANRVPLCVGIDSHVLCDHVEESHLAMQGCPVRNTF